MADELLTPAEMAVADRTAVALGHGVPALMEAAGRAVARAMQARFTPCPTLVLCGPGNNGGDGVVAARYLARQGWPVSVAFMGTPPGGPAPRWHGPVAPFTQESAARAELVVDAVFGAGLARDVAPEVAAVLLAARQLVAVDVPSGLDGATGQLRGDAPQAVLTVTFFRLKPGHLLLPGRGLCGETVLTDIGIPNAVLQAVKPQAWRNGRSLWSLPQAGADDHKYTRGHVTILGGAEMTGAARLAAASAHRGGAGMVTIAASRGADLYRSGDPGILVSDTPLKRLIEDRRRNAWVCGPGLGIDAAAAALPALLASGQQVVADADALTACAGQPERLRGAAVLTPHAGEFARVFGALSADRVDAVRRAAALTGAVVLLKGADTIVAAADGRVAINDSAPPWLATAGAGDVLAGLIAALLGQGMAPWQAACAGAWLHGRAAALAGPGLIAKDLPAMIRRAMFET